MAGAKPGAYPYADRANLFGTFLVTFYEMWHSGGDRDQCWPSFMAILGIVRPKADPKFKQAYEDFDFKAAGLAEMNALVHECIGLMDRIGTYEYTGEEFADEYDPAVQEEDVVSDAHRAKA